MIDFREYITIDAKKRFGKPIVKGTRITVYDVLNWMANGMSKQEILSDFPELSKETIQACLAYVANRERRMQIATDEAVI